MTDNTDKDYLLLKKAFDKQINYEPIWLENERYFEGKFDKKRAKKLEALGRSGIFIPVTRNIVNILKSIFSTSFFGAGCPIEITNTTREKNEYTTDLQKVVKYYYDLYKPRKELSKAFLSALIYKIGIVVTYWDSQRQKVQTFNIPVTDIAFDYEARNSEDIEYIGYFFHESRREVEEKIKSKFYKPNKEDKKEIIDNKDITDRYKIEEIYIRKGKKWLCKTFYNGYKLREVEFEKLPFQFGYAIEELPYIDSERRKDQILCYGSSIPEYIKSLQDEVNLKRNQKNDIQEEMINPSIIIPDLTQIDPQDMKRGAGKRIRAKGGTAGIMFMPTPSDYSLNADLGILDNDISTATGVNSVQMGQTGSSDRRSAQALAVVNANSSMRVEEMIMTINDTLFEHWAKQFTRLILKNAEDSVINEITGKENPFGKKGTRKIDDYQIVINFGLTIDKEKRMSDLLMIAQMLAQNPNINPQIVMNLIKDVLEIRLGETVKIEDIFNIQGNEQVSNDDLQNTEQQTKEQEAVRQQLDNEYMALLEGAV